MPFLHTRTTSPDAERASHVDNTIVAAHRLAHARGAQ